MFRDHAQRALAAAGLSALELFDRNPGCTKLELTKRLNRGANAIGFGMVLYAEAQQAGRLREIASALFVAKILDKFPGGWNSSGTVHPLVKIGGWDDDIEKGVADPRVRAASQQIVRTLAIDEPPPEGWKPQSKDDPRIVELFDRFWPAE
jgi:hypothetical protein